MKKFILATLLMMMSASAWAEKYSSIEGHPVKVGEKNRYEYAIKKWNVGLNLLTLPLEEVSASASYAFTSNMALRVAGAHKLGSSSDKANLRVGVPIYFAKAYTGLFIEPGMDSHAGVYSALGYHWMWDSGFNLHIGTGIGKKGAVGMLQTSYAFGD